MLLVFSIMQFSVCQEVTIHEAFTIGRRQSCMVVQDFLKVSEGAFDQVVGVRHPLYLLELEKHWEIMV